MHEDLLYRILSKSDEKRRKYGQNLIYSLSKVWLSVYHFSQNLYLLNGNMSISSVLNFIQVGHELWELWIEIHLHP
jgi:hypothetical protein